MGLDSWGGGGVWGNLGFTEPKKRRMGLPFFFVANMIEKLQWNFLRNGWGRSLNIIRWDGIRYVLLLLMAVWGFGSLQP